MDDGIFLGERWPEFRRKRESLEPLLTAMVQVLPSLTVRERKKHININKFAGLSRDWGGAKKLFMCFFRVIPYGGEKHINKIPPKIPGQSREKFVYVFFSLCVFFSLPKQGSASRGFALRSVLPLAPSPSSAQVAGSLDVNMPSLASSHKAALHAWSPGLSSIHSSQKMLHTVEFKIIPYRVLFFLNYLP